MKKINLFNHITVVSRNEFLKAANSARPFAITYDGQIVYEPFDQDLIAVFEGSIPPVPLLSASTARPIASMLPDSYKVVEDDDRILIKSAAAWQNIISLNRLRALYDDTSGDGIDKFADKELEQIGWHATEFNITYREIVERFEEECEGVLLCIEREEPYQFSGLGFITDMAQARDTAFRYCAEKIQNLIQNDPDYSTLSSDEEEAAEFFKVL